MKKQHDEIMYMLGKIDGKTSSMEKHLEAQNNRLNKHEKRLRGLERWRYWVTGGATMLGAIVGFFIRKDL